MLPVGIFIGFAVLYLSAKLMERKVPFYAAAAIFVVGTFLFEQVASLFKLPISVPGLLIQYVVALPVFYLLNYYEDTIAKWLATYAVGGIILVYFF